MSFVFRKPYAEVTEAQRSPRVLKQFVESQRSQLIATATEPGVLAVPKTAAGAVGAPRDPSQRLLSLDVFRGLTIAAMILVNNPGSWSAIYWPLAHAEWHGWTPTDLIFPFFLFIVGVSMPLSFASRTKHGVSRTALFAHSTVRSALIFAIGLSMAGFPYYNLSAIRIPGVLQRIAVCYFFAALCFLFLNRRARIGVIASLLLGYWVLMTLAPVPGFGAGRLDVDGNLAAYVDRAVLRGHLWKPTWDPEGLLSTLPAIATAMLGMFLGESLLRTKSPSQNVRLMLIWGAAGLAAGQLWHFAFPINKNLWTSSYVIFTAGFALLVLAICAWLMEVKAWRAWAAPFVWYGMNPLALFVFSGLLARLLGLWRVTLADGRSVAMKTYLYDSFFVPLASPKNASLLFALAYVAFWLAIAWALYRRKIFIKI